MGLLVLTALFGTPAPSASIAAAANTDTVADLGRNREERQRGQRAKRRRRVPEKKDGAGERPLPQRRVRRAGRAVPYPDGHPLDRHRLLQERTGREAQAEIKQPTGREGRRLESESDSAYSKLDDVSKSSAENEQTNPETEYLARFLDAIGAGASQSYAPPAADEGNDQQLAADAASSLVPEMVEQYLPGSGTRLWSVVVGGAGCSNDDDGRSLAATGIRGEHGREKLPDATGVAGDSSTHPVATVTAPEETDESGTAAAAAAAEKHHSDRERGERDPVTEGVVGGGNDGAGGGGDQKDENGTKPPLDYTLSEKTEHQQSADGADGAQDGASGLVGGGAEIVSGVDTSAPDDEHEGSNQGNEGAGTDFVTPTDEGKNGTAAGGSDGPPVALDPLGGPVGEEGSNGAGAGGPTNTQGGGGGDQDAIIILGPIHPHRPYQPDSYPIPLSAPTYRPLRIRAVLTEAEARHLTPAQRSYLLERVLHPAMEAWSVSLMVVPVDGALTIDPAQLYDGKSCGPGVESGQPSVLVPAEHFANGVEWTDLVVYVSVSFRGDPVEEEEEEDEDENISEEEREDVDEDDEQEDGSDEDQDEDDEKRDDGDGSDAEETGTDEDQDVLPTSSPSLLPTASSAPTAFNLTLGALANFTAANYTSQNVDPQEQTEHEAPPKPRTCPRTSYLASAAYCSTDQHDRPVAGMIHLCLDPEEFFPPESGTASSSVSGTGGSAAGYAGLSDREERKKREEDEEELERDRESRRIRRRTLRTLATRTCLHELGHVLGFNSQSLAHFRYPGTGTPRTPRDENGDVPDVLTECVGPADPPSVSANGAPTDSYDRKGEDPSAPKRRTAKVPLPSTSTLAFRERRGGVRVAEVTTDTVARVVRNRFGCPGLDGAELESGLGWRRPPSRQQGGAEEAEEVDEDDIDDANKGSEEEEDVDNDEKESGEDEEDSDQRDGEDQDEQEEQGEDNKKEDEENKEEDEDNKEDVDEDDSTDEDGQEEQTSDRNEDEADRKDKGKNRNKKKDDASEDEDDRKDEGSEDGGSDAAKEDDEDDQDDHKVDENDDLAWRHDKGNAAEESPPATTEGQGVVDDEATVTQQEKDLIEEDVEDEYDYDGNEGCIGNHLERRLFKNDVMNPVIDLEDAENSPLRISSITLAYFADSGWYLPDPGRAAFDNPGTWGRAAGCDFVEKKCVTRNGKVTASNAQFFCGDVSSVAPQDDASKASSGGGLRSSGNGVIIIGTEIHGCTPDMTRKALCSASRYDQEDDEEGGGFGTTTIPPEYQYFNSRSGLGPTIGGSDPDLDFCPVYSGFANGLCAALPDSSTGSAEVLRVHKSEEFGVPNSRCVSGRIDGRTTALCVPIACVVRDQTLRVKVDGYWEICDRGGQMLPMSWGGDAIVCPDPRRTCPTFYCPRDCFGFEGGVCDYKTGKCMCPLRTNEVASATGSTAWKGSGSSTTTAQEEEEEAKFIECGTGDSSNSGSAGYLGDGSGVSSSTQDDSSYAAYYVEDAAMLRDTQRSRDILSETQRAFESMTPGEVFGLVASILLVVLSVGLGSTFVYQFGKKMKARGGGVAGARLPFRLVMTTLRRRRRRNPALETVDEDHRRRTRTPFSFPRGAIVRRPPPPTFRQSAGGGVFNYGDNGFHNEEHHRRRHDPSLSRSSSHENDDDEHMDRLRRLRNARARRDDPAYRARKDKVVASMLVHLRVHDPRVMRRLRHERRRRMLRERMRRIRGEDEKKLSPSSGSAAGGAGLQFTTPPTESPVPGKSVAKGKGKNVGGMLCADGEPIEEGERVVRRSELPPLPSGRDGRGGGRVVAVVGAYFLDDLQHDGDDASSYHGTEISEELVTNATLVENSSAETCSSVACHDEEEEGGSYSGACASIDEEDACLHSVFPLEEVIEEHRCGYGLNAAATTVRRRVNRESSVGGNRSGRRPASLRPGGWRRRGGGGRMGLGNHHFDHV